MKGKAIANHFAHYSSEEVEENQGDFPNEYIIRIEVEPWKMYFNGATNQNGSGIGVLLISLKGTHINNSLILYIYIVIRKALSYLFLVNSCIL